MNSLHFSVLVAHTSETALSVKRRKRYRKFVYFVLCLFTVFLCTNVPKQAFEFRWSFLYSTKQEGHPLSSFLLRYDKDIMKENVNESGELPYITCPFSFLRHKNPVCVTSIILDWHRLVTSDIWSKDHKFIHSAWRCTLVLVPLIQIDWYPSKSQLFITMVSLIWHFVPENS